MTNKAITHHHQIIWLLKSIIWKKMLCVYTEVSKFSVIIIIIIHQPTSSAALLTYTILFDSGHLGSTLMISALHHLPTEWLAYIYFCMLQLQDAVLCVYLLSCDVACPAPFQICYSLDDVHYFISSRYHLVRDSHHIPFHRSLSTLISFFLFPVLKLMFPSRKLSLGGNSGAKPYT